MLSLDKQNEWREQYRAAHPGWQPATELYANLVRLHLTPEAQVLDIGCGRGGLVEQLEHPLAQVVGIDPDWLSLREHRLNLTSAVAFSDDLPFAPATFDLAFASWVLEHLARPFLTLQSIARVLKPGGAFVFITPNGRHPLALLNKTMGKLGALQGRVVARLYGRSADDTFATHYRTNSQTALEKLAAQSSLHLTQLHHVPDPTYLAFNRPLFRLMSLLENTLPAGRKIHLVGVLVKSGG
ncbi:class I SAM-dependent methyltransferase [Candidatus Leptofilum sp.]|uniref:class I SAM-dependent methyltransferase n=1 Tax=Candidatus Leptofilum sp. TaxID=3241576 RepID=UPI003B5902A1